MLDYILKILSFFWNSSNHYLLGAFIIFYVYLTYKGLIGIFYNKKIKRQLNTLISKIPNEPVNSSCEFSRQDIIASGIQNNKNIILLNSTLNANGYDILSYEECFSICINSKYNKFFLYKCFFEDYETYTNAYKKYKNIRQLLDLYNVDSFFALFSIIAILLLIPNIYITNISFPLGFITYLCVTLLTAIFIFFGYYNWKLQKTIKFLHNDKTMRWYVRYCFIKDMIEKSIELYNREIFEQKQKEEQQRKIIEEEKQRKIREEEERKLKQQRSYWEKYWAEKQKDGFEFERAVGELYGKMGYQYTVTKGTGDDGVDLILYKDGIKTIVQCKAHKHVVGPNDLRALWGCMQDFKAQNAIFIAYAGVTNGANKFTRGKDYKILSVKDLIELSLNACSEQGVSNTKEEVRQNAKVESQNFKAEKQKYSYWEKYWAEKQKNIFEFNRAVGELYGKMGYEYKVISGTYNDCVDLVLYKDGIKTIVQCNSHNHVVGDSAVRALWDVKEDYSAQKAIFIAYSGVTTGAWKFARSKNMVILDANELINLSLELNKAKQIPEKISSKQETIDNTSNNSNWLLIKDEVFERYGEFCINCGTTKNIDVHHKIPLSEGGTNCLDNLIPLCRTCHEELHRFKMSTFGSETKIDNQYGNTISNNKKSLIGYKICDAVEHGYRIKIKYKSGKADYEKITERIIYPIEIKLGCECQNYDLIKKSGYDKYKKFLRAFCELRNEERLFRIDRIIDVIEEYKS